MMFRRTSFSLALRVGIISPSMFDTDQFIADCRAVVAEQGSHMAVKELVARAVSDPASVLKGLGEPTEAGVNELFVFDKLTALTHAGTFCI